MCIFPVMHKTLMRAWQLRAEPEEDLVDATLATVSSMKPGSSAGFGAAVEVTKNTRKEIKKAQNERRRPNNTSQILRRRRCQTFPDGTEKHSCSKNELWVVVDLSLTIFHCCGSCSQTKHQSGEGISSSLKAKQQSSENTWTPFITHVNNLDITSC